MTRYRVLPYKQGSLSACALALALGGKVLKLQGSHYHPRPSDLIINWGNTSFNYQAQWGDDYIILNYKDLVHCVSNKLLFFRRMATECPGLTPAFWEKKEDIPEDAYPVVCRLVLAGHSGAGIVIADSPDDLVDAPLYVKYEKKKEEYRVHVGKKLHIYTADPFVGPEYATEVISLQRKARRTDTPPEQVNWQVRNHSNGFIYKRQGFVAPPSVIDGAKLALEASGLDFGAVDVIYNTQQEKAYVLEINSAPGIEGQTIADYAAFFQGFVAGA